MAWANKAADGNIIVFTGSSVPGNSAEESEDPPARRTSQLLTDTTPCYFLSEEELTPLYQLSPAHRVAEFRPGFLRDLGNELARQREAKGISIRQLTTISGLSRQSIRRLEDNEVLGGATLRTLHKYVVGVGAIVRVKLTFEGLGENSKRPSILVSMKEATAPGEFAADLVRAVRNASGLRQCDLEAGFADGLEPDTASGFISRLENGRQPAGARIGTLFAIALHAGYLMEVARPASSLREKSDGSWLRGTDGSWLRGTDAR